MFVLVFLFLINYSSGLDVLFLCLVILGLVLIGRLGLIRGVRFRIRIFRRYDVDRLDRNDGCSLSELRFGIHTFR
jgi:hypothetical protein